ncbi:MAG: penicillin-binding protein 2 [Bacillota bacterium]
MENKKKFEKKLRIYFLIVTVIFAVLLSRLFYLQVLHTADFQAQSAKNRTRWISLEARRGDVLDRNKEVLATSKPVFSISVSNLGLKNQAEINQRLAEILDNPEITGDFITKKLRSNPRRYEPVEIISLPWSEETLALITRIQENRRDLPGVVIQEAPMRYYPNGSLAGHLLGFVGQITQRELELFKERGYGINDKIGKTGLERGFELAFDDDGKEIGLRGVKGFSQIVVNAKNRLVGELGTVPPLPGHNVQLTLDAGLQSTLEKAMDEVIGEVKKANPKAGAGAAVVLDVNTGAILAMASRPELDPNDFVDGSFTQKRDYYGNQDLNPSLNRAIQGVYPPGSTFKMVTGMAALESGRIKPTDTILCSGKFWQPGGIICTQSHGAVDFFRALAVSCNTYFQWAGEIAGINKMVEVAKSFGLGTKTGLTDIGGEVSGLMPSPQWKSEVNRVLVNRRYERRRAELDARYNDMLAKAQSAAEREALLKKLDQEKRALEARYKIDLEWETRWQLFETYNTSIGQGANQYTILQLANYVATIANNGVRYQPYLVDKILDQKGQVIKQYKPVILEKVAVSPATLANTQRAMRAVTESGGTAVSPFRHFPRSVQVAAKTGTAQTGRVGDDKTKDFFGIFVAYAPADNPQIAFAAIIEYARSGGGSAGRVAKAVFEDYFGIQPPVVTSPPRPPGTVAVPGAPSTGVQSGGAGTPLDSPEVPGTEGPPAPLETVQQP